MSAFPAPAPIPALPLESPHADPADMHSVPVSREDHVLDMLRKAMRGELTSGCIIAATPEVRENLEFVRHMPLDEAVRESPYDFAVEVINTSRRRIGNPELLAQIVAERMLSIRETERSEPGKYRDLAFDFDRRVYEDHRQIAIYRNSLPLRAWFVAVTFQQPYGGVSHVFRGMFRCGDAREVELGLRKLQQKAVEKRVDRLEVDLNQKALSHLLEGKNPACPIAMLEAIPTSIGKADSGSLLDLARKLHASFQPTQQ
jgi:hypothetical protein